MLHAMRDSHEPRGFSGSPLIAVVYAVGMGCLAYYLSSRTHACDPTVPMILGGISVLVPAYLWNRGAKPKQPTAHFSLFPSK
jgi:hypothetical protein